MNAREPRGESIHALVADASERQALIAMRQLGSDGLRVGAAARDPSAPAFVSRWCAMRSLVPDFALHSDEYVDALLDLCQTHGVRALIPVHDGPINALQRRRSDVEKVVRLALAPADAVAAATDKARTLAAAERVGVGVPRGASVAAPGDADRAIDEVGLPAVVKPLRSWLQGEGRGGLVRAALVTRRDEAVDAVKRLLDAGAEVAVQEWLPGDREAVSFIYADGRFWTRFAQRADRMLPVLGGNSITRESIPLPPDITAAGERLVEELGMEGYSEVEFRRNRDGEPALMEINPRLSASVEIAVRAGIPFPRLLYEWARGGTLREYQSYRTGRRMRYLGGDIGWLWHALTERGNPELPRPGRAVGIFFADFLKPSGYDYLGWRDPRPAARATAHYVREQFRRRVPAG